MGGSRVSSIGVRRWVTRTSIGSQSAQDVLAGRAIHLHWCLMTQSPAKVLRTERITGCGGNTMQCFANSVASTAGHKEDSGCDSSLVVGCWRLGGCLHFVLATTVVQQARGMAEPKRIRQRPFEGGARIWCACASCR